MLKRSLTMKYLMINYNDTRKTRMHSTKLNMQIGYQYSYTGTYEKTAKNILQLIDELLLLHTPLPLPCIYITSYSTYISRIAHGYVIKNSHFQNIETNLYVLEFVYTMSS